jgi:hypothetical protein
MQLLHSHLWASLECALLGVVLLFLACVVKIVWKIRLSATTLECAFAPRVLVSVFCCLWRFLREMHWGLLLKCALLYQGLFFYFEYAISLQQGLFVCCLLACVGCQEPWEKWTNWATFECALQQEGMLLPCVVEILLEKWIGLLLPDLHCNMGFCFLLVSCQDPLEKWIELLVNLHCNMGGCFLLVSCQDSLEKGIDWATLERALQPRLFLACVVENPFEKLMDWKDA